jgi:hypothetical protein
VIIGMTAPVFHRRGMAQCNPVMAAASMHRYDRWHKEPADARRRPADCPPPPMNAVAVTLLYLPHRETRN